jgi:hypothetical protein
MTVYNNYSLRNLPSVHYGRMNIWNRYENHAQAMRADFYRTVPPYSSSVFWGFPMCCTPFPMGGCCWGGPMRFVGGFALGSMIGSTVGAIVGLVRNIFKKS